jgi:hypothetical protein
MILASLFALKLQPISGAAPMPTSSDRKITANRANASHSTGPRSSAGKAKSRLNALKHGLRAEQVVIPGEDPRAFEAECAAWSADWQPKSHTRAILVERAAATSWRLRRCVRIEGMRLQQMSLRNMLEYDKLVAKRILASVQRLRTEPAEAVAELMMDAHGITTLMDLWDELAEAAIEPGGWCKFTDHHDRMLALLGFAADADCDDVGDIAHHSFRLTITNDPSQGGHGGGPMSPDEATECAAELMAFFDARVTELNEALANSLNPNIARYKFADEVCVDATDTGKALQRYETTLDRSLRSTISQLIQLERTGADLTEDEPELEVMPEAVAAPNEATEVVVKESVAPNEATEEALARNEAISGGSLADLRDRGGRVWGLGDGSNPLVGDVGAEIDKV